ncbi:hypothetical protein [Pseudomonas mosselii]|uniref:hypothetical protein n=1 Tax=Pseudomonas mosselii TaxID=78327 RepID=UPI0021DA1867|nr:hypothetical protein [Pseudomonas mosselii]MCU9530461.1 hypothetical protein [Pseudomonas mosselii]MCU9537634.1 hypothetical protein [Pseudomonas mosselii]MCU9543589.1 hypothetical protein [Pseudomonas mosselii]MCU9549520.1 hypothetical protein [Pseudomonas mosselii]
MLLLRFLLSLFTFIGALAAAGALVISILLMLRFPPLLVAVLLACWILNRLIKVLTTQTASRTKSPVRQKR